MLAQMAELSAPLRAEVALLDSWLAEPFNQLFVENG
jgi:hypothetical protein